MNHYHQGQPVFTIGVPLTQARAAAIMIHGRGATAESILSLANEFNASDLAYLAPQAANNTWYPYRFLEPLGRNEPWLSSALQVVDDLIKYVIASGIPTERLMLLGFSQGACLTLDYAARHAQRYGGLVGLSGGLIGPEIEPQRYAGSFGGTPIFLGCSDIDPHIPLERVHATTRLLQQLGGDVTERIYPDMDHTVNQDEIDFVSQLLQDVSHSA
ncbi:MAG TPA: dienelactone hydrolase family protein [Anaerolineae bacterium]|nr:dienelactone hydrolase family protein [Anaerolineae bacterium]